MIAPRVSWKTKARLEHLPHEAQASAGAAAAGRRRPSMSSTAHIQLALDELVAQGGWNGSVYMGAPSVRRLDSLRKKTILLLGDSTLRAVYDLNPWTGDGQWVSGTLKCDPALGVGCDDCVIPCSNQETLKKWRDSTRLHLKSTVGMQSVSMSYKPQLFSAADAAAFHARFCVTPPHLVVVGKGLHDACFSPCGYILHAIRQDKFGAACSGGSHHRNISSLTDRAPWLNRSLPTSGRESLLTELCEGGREHVDVEGRKAQPKCTVGEHAQWVEGELRALAKVLRCLPPPPRTLVVWRTPLMTEPLVRAHYHGSRDCRDLRLQEPWINVTAQVMRRLHASGSVFGSSDLLLDAHAISTAAIKTPGAPKTVDGHHYHAPLNSMQGRLFEWLLEQGELLSSSGKRKGVRSYT